MKLEFEYLPINSLKEYEKNARKHNDFDVNIIKKSIEEFGFNDPIGIWGKDNIIVEGHGRLLAARALGMTEVPVVRLDHLTSEQRKMYALEHNRSAEMSTWDMETLMGELEELKGSFDINELGFQEFFLDEAVGDEPVQEDDFDPVIQPDACSQPGDIYVLGDHRLMCGDSTDRDSVSMLLGGEDVRVDLVYTDPPYNVNVSNSDGLTIQNDNLDEETFVEILEKAFDNAGYFLKPGGAFYVWHGENGRVKFQHYLENNGLIVKQCLIWAKNGFTFGRQDYKWQHEPCLYGWKEGAGHYFVAEFNHPTVIETPLDLEKMKKEDLLELCRKLLDNQGPSTLFHENKPIKNDLHPTMKPLTLCGDMIHNSSKPGESVLDLFGGSGSTMIACEQLHRKCYMMEIDPCYVDVDVKRYVKYMGSAKDCYLIRDGKQLPLPQDLVTLL